MRRYQCPDGVWVDEEGCREGLDWARELLEHRPNTGRTFICFSCPRLIKAEERDEWP